MVRDGPVATWSENWGVGYLVTFQVWREVVV